MGPRKEQRMEIKAVGIAPNGKMYSINTEDQARGLRLLRIIVAVDQEDWWLKNQEVLERCIFNVEGAAIDLLFDVMVDKEEDPRTPREGGPCGKFLDIRDPGEHPLS
jgi:hypothetical protein